MATIDPSIAMGYKPIQIENPLNQLAAYSQIQSGQQNQQLNALKIREAEQGIENRNALRNLDPNDPDYISKIIRIDPALGLEFQTKQAAAKTSGLQAIKLQTETEGLQFKQRIDKANKALADISALDTPQEALAGIAKHLASGDIDQAKADNLRRSITMAPSFRDWQKSTLVGILDAKDQIVTQETARANAERERIAAEQLRVSKSNLAVNQQDLSNKYDPVVQSNLARGRKEGEFIAATQSPFAPKVIAANQGKVDVGDLTTLMGGSYAKLNELKGITSTARSGKSNLGASAQSSMAGQLVGGALGTQEQSERDFIKSQRPLLVQAIVKATGITAGQINSNAELKNLLDAATDPNKGFESNARSLNEINRRFGTGKEVLPLTPNSPNIDALLEKYK